MSVHDLPALNAILNGVAAVLLVCGFTLIRRGRKQAHRRVMLTAFTVSVLFLISYIVYHVEAGVIRFQKAGLIRGSISPFCLRTRCWRQPSRRSP